MRIHGGCSATTGWRERLERYLGTDKSVLGGAKPEPGADTAPATDGAAFGVAVPALADGGKHLGILGSSVVADVIYGGLQQDALFGIEGCADLPHQLANLAQRAFGPGSAAGEEVFGSLGNVKTFHDLLQFLGARIECPGS